MNRLFIICALLFPIAFAQNAAAQSRRFGLGLVVGEPTGISAKLWTSDINAFDFGLGWSGGEERDEYVPGRYDGESRTHFHLDYVWHSFDAIRSSERFPIYYGFGAGINSGGGGDPTAALRGVFGISWLPRRTPIDLFLEISPSLPLIIAAGLDFQLSLGSRYFF